MHGWEELLLAAIEQSLGHAVSEPMGAALRSTPRHAFLRRFRRRHDHEWRSLTPDTLALHAPVIYGDEPLALFQPSANAPIVAAQSTPSTTVWILEQLAIRPGHALLEIGSGSGWLIALASRIVGKEGIARGIEYYPELAEESRASLAALGCANVEIRAGDGAQGWPAQQPYDRVAITPCLGVIPSWIFRDTAPDARIAFPFAVPGGGDCMIVAQREGDCFRSVDVLPALSVSAAGELSGPATRLRPMPHADAAGVAEHPLIASWREHRDGFILATLDFRFFLSVTRPDFAAFTRGTLTNDALAFGLASHDSSRFALFTSRGLLANDAAWERRLRAAARRWSSLGKPGLAYTRLEIHEHAPPRVPRGTHVTSSSGFGLVWKLAAA